MVVSGPRMMGDEAASEPSQDLPPPVRPQMAPPAWFDEVVTDSTGDGLVSLIFLGLVLTSSMSLSDVAMVGAVLEG